MSAGDCPFCQKGSMREIYLKESFTHIYKEARCDACGWIAAMSVDKEFVVRLEGVSHENQR